VRIARIDVYTVPYHHAAGPFVMSGGRVSTEQDSTVVRIETDDGLVGWGEACVISPDYAPGYGPSTRAVMPLLGEALLGCDPRRVEVVGARLQAAARGHETAKSALDMACWDILGHATGMRLCDLLGGAHQERVPLYVGVGIAAPDVMRERCRAVVAAGYGQVQVKIGTTCREDVERVAACLEELPGVDTVIVDANGYYPQADAIRLLGLLEGRPFTLEQPCATTAECAAARRASRRPTVLDESLFTLADVLAARDLDALDAVRLKLTRFGGLTAARRARDLALALGLQVTVEDSGGGDIVTAATVHMAASIPPRLLLAGYLPSEMTAERIATGTPAACDGHARVPEGPGLGIEVDEAALGAPVMRLE
jgi:L-alanine-DL-glutamate epimerase-like enolase superfamily enzyme